MFLAGAAGAGVAEDNNGGATGAIDDDLAETTWCCYAWPANYNNSGNRSFFVNQTGDVTATDVSTYEGANGIADANCGAAFMPGGGATEITGNVAIGTVARDGNLWKQVN
jgi:hypothetical protein